MGNFSRNTFSPQKGYVSVRLQQGVPLVDADWNELSDVTRDETYRSVALTSADGVESKAFEFLAGTPNNPTVMGGTGIVNGRTFQSGPIAYDTQPWRNPATAAADGVPVIPALTTPTANRTDIGYLDVWEREVGQAEDPNIVNPAIGVETSVRLRRDVALRVAEGTTTLPTEPAGHAHIPLALFNRPAGSNTVLPQHREDLRRFLNVVSLVPAFTPVLGLPERPVPPRRGPWRSSTTSRSPPIPPPGSRLSWTASCRLPYPRRPAPRAAGQRYKSTSGSGRCSSAVESHALPAGDRGAARRPTRWRRCWRDRVPGGDAIRLHAVVPSNGLEIVDNARFSYGIRAWSNMGQGGAIHGLSLTYTF